MKKQILHAFSNKKDVVLCGRKLRGAATHNESEVTCNNCKRLLEKGFGYKGDKADIWDRLSYPCTVAEAALAWGVSFYAAKQRLYQGVYKDIVFQNDNKQYEVVKGERG